MKKIVLVLLGFVITVTGFSAFAVLAGCRAPEYKNIHMNKSGKMHKSMRQLDEIDKLLILVNIEEKKQMFKGHQMQNFKQHPMRSKYGRKHMMSKKMPCSSAKISKMSCTPGKVCQAVPEHKKFSAKRYGHGFNKNAILKAYLLKNYPKEIKALAEQKKDNDKAAKELLEKATKIVREAKAKMKAEHEQFAKMIADYKKSKDEKIAAQIKAKLSEFYDMRLKKMKEKIDNEYKELKKKRANKDKEITEKFERITR